MSFSINPIFQQHRTFQITDNASIILTALSSQLFPQLFTVITSTVVVSDGIVQLIKHVIVATRPRPDTHLHPRVVIWPMDCYVCRYLCVWNHKVHRESPWYIETSIWVNHLTCFSPVTWCSACSNWSLPAEIFVLFVEPWPSSTSGLRWDGSEGPSTDFAQV